MKYIPASKKIVAAYASDSPILGLRAYCSYVMVESCKLTSSGTLELLEIFEDAWLNYEHWCQEYVGDDLLDDFAGFMQMLNELPLPWPFSDHSFLNGKDLSTVLLSIAFNLSERSLQFMRDLNERENDVSKKEMTDLVWTVMSALRFLEQGKSILNSRNDCVFQRFKYIEA